MFKNHIKNKILRSLAEFAVSAAITAIVFVLLWNFVIRTGRVYGYSMEPTLNHGEIVLINKAAYYFKDPDFGDIIAFPSPRNPREEYVKRVIGLPGDEIDYNPFTGEIYINGEKLEDEFVSERSGGYSVDFPLIVPDGTVFVLGDNRWASEDSRYKEIGCVEIRKIMGKVVLRVYPFGKFGTVK